MGEDQGKVGAVTEEHKTPEQLRSEIEQTREELGDTAAALGAKADVKGRAKERVHELKEKASATPVTATVKDNPVPAAAIGLLLAGFALGWLVGGRRRR
jgi:hypothetical protein